LAMMKRLQGSGDPARVKDALERGQAYLGQLANLQLQLPVEQKPRLKSARVI